MWCFIQREMHLHEGQNWNWRNTFTVSYYVCCKSFAFAFEINKQMSNDYTKVHSFKCLECRLWMFLILFFPHRLDNMKITEEWWIWEINVLDLLYSRILRIMNLTIWKMGLIKMNDAYAFCFTLCLLLFITMVITDYRIISWPHICDNVINHEFSLLYYCAKHFKRPEP